MLFEKEMEFVYVAGICFLLVLYVFAIKLNEVENLKIIFYSKL